MPINTNYYEFTENAIKNKSNSVGNKITEFKIKKGQTVKFGLFLYSKPTQSTTFTFYKNEGDDFESFANFQTYTLNVKFERTYTATEDTEICIVMWGNADSEIFEFQLWAELDELTNYLKYEEQNYILDIQQEMLKGDCFVKESDGWKEFHNWNKKELTGNENIALEETYNGIAQFCIKDITNAKWNNDRYTINAYSNYFKAVAFTDSWTKDEVVTITGRKTVRFMSSKYTTVAEFKQFLQEKYTEGNPVVVYYKLETLEELSCTEEQSAILDKLNDLDLFDGTNNIITTEDIALLKLKYVVDTKTYIDNKYNQLANQILDIAGGN